MFWPFDREAPARIEDEDATLRALLPDVRRWVARYAGPRNDLDDLVQEAMIELVVALERFRGDASVRTYARRIVMRTTLRELRARRSRHQHLELVGEPETESDAPDPERLVSSRRAIAAFYAALETLSEKRRNAFVLCAIERLSHDEAAAVEGTSIETVRARLKHARADLSANLRAHPALSHLFGEDE